jgi:nicotinate dehydrogenase subunit B
VISAGTGVVSLHVNGVEREIAPDAGFTLLAALRSTLGLTGAKPGCGEGACGACTVLLDGEPVHACVTPLAEAAEKSVTTIEGLALGAALHPVQQAFVDEGAMQCGYCTPGMVLTAAALLADDPDPEPEAVRGALSGNLCRCCAYPRIERAVLRAAAVLRGETSTPAAAADEEPPTATFPGFRPRAPWDLVTAAEREYFDLLGDGLVVFLDPRGRHDGGAFGGTGGAWLHVSPDLVVTAFTGKVDIGQDNRTALAMVVAEELAAPLASVRLAMGDTDLCPYDLGTFGSRSLPDAGEDLRVCAATARRLLEHDRPVPGARRLEPARLEALTVAHDERRYVGRPVARAGGRARVTGSHLFPSDLVRSGMLHGRILWPPAYGAVLRRVDVEPARAVAGAVVVAEEGIVAAAAAHPALAAEALATVKADWEEREQPVEQELVAFLRARPLEAAGWEHALEEEVGDVERGLTAADVRLEATYTTAYIAHVSLETRVALAEWEDERVTIRTGAQQPFELRALVAERLRISEEQVRVLVPDFGGGFGSKHPEEIALAAALLARAAGRPVRVALSREEEFRHSYLRPAAVIDVRSGARSDGAVTALEQRTLNAGAAALRPPYALENSRIAFQPADSPLPQGPYRALAATANTFARESHLDELARILDADPLELRLRHLDDQRLAAVLHAAADGAGWGRPRAAGTGLGLAVGLEKGGRVATCAEVRVQAGELVIVRIVTAYECGTIVNPDNLRRQIEAAAVMGLGGALFEAAHFDRGRLTDASLSRYRVPRFGDVPPLEVLLLDRPDLPSAGGGETPMIALAPALANAIADACGTRIRALPLLHEGRLAAHASM